jgi:Fe-Mn family superoxide dismutase
MKYEAKNFDQLLGTSGFSDALLKNHFTLYQGYVSNTNAVSDAISALVRDGKTGPEFAELKRRFGWEWNGMRLHEYYFGNMAKSAPALNKSSDFAKKLAEDFGSFEAWEKDFRATGAMRGIGWVTLYLDRCANRLFNVWINEHDLGHLAGAEPILIMDVFEHAFMLDYGLKRADYIAAFFKAVDWNVAQQRFDAAAVGQHAR